MMSNQEPAYFPLFVDLSEKKIVVIGAGNIAGRRIKTLTQFTRQIKVVAPAIHPSIEALAEEFPLTLERKLYEREDIYSADMVIAATDDAKLNEEIHSVCKCLGILVNVISDKDKCDFHFPGVIKREQLVIGVNAGGKNHKLAKAIREKIEKIL